MEDVSAASRPPVSLLILALGVAALPLVGPLPGWAICGCMAAWGHSLAVYRYGWRPIGRWGRTGLFFLCLGAVAASSGMRFDGRDFITLLVVMAGLKPMEVKTRRDSMVTVFVAYFLVITCLFNFESLTMTVYLFVSVWVTTGVLIRVNHPGQLFTAQMRLAGRLVLLALPFMAALFMLFPRLSGGFVGTPWNRQGMAHISDTIRMGDLSRLASSEEPAFSVFFEGPPPPPTQRYWRGIVFDYLDGETARQERRPRSLPRQRQHTPAGQTQVAYTVILEPTGQRVLFTLDLPASVSGVSAVIRDNDTTAVFHPINQRLRYEAVSVLDARRHMGSPPEAKDLQLPIGYHPRSVALARQWAADAQSAGKQAPEAVIAAAMQFFQTSDFLYTLSPGRIQGDGVDTFLFDGKRGYCEHFAVSMTVLMRAAGIPARMVGGYLGGAWNAVGEFLQVRQSHAHVWCEIWLEEKGWVRVDPTSVVAPERIGEGSGSNAGDDAGKLFVIRWYETARDTWEMVNLRWDVWFMGFSEEDQMALLKRLGIAAGRGLQWVIFVGATILMAGVGVMMFRLCGRRSDRASDRAQRIYRRFLDKMTRIGIPKAAHEGPMVYAKAVGQAHPELKPAVDLITWHYVRLRYGPPPSPVSLGDFSRQVSQFNPKTLKKH